MRATAFLLVALPCLAYGTTVETAESVTPVQKVIQLMEGMAAKGKEEKHKEQVQFAAYKQFCDDTAVEKKRAIEEADEKIGVLKADIEKYTSDVEQLTKEIAGHDDDLAAWTGDEKAATKVRAMEKGDYDETHKDYSESIDALERAIAVMKKQAYTRKQESFAQLSAVGKMALIPDHARKVIEAFLQQDPDEGLAVSAPEAAGYEFQSQGVIEMMEKLLDKFIDERTVLEKEEMSSVQAFELLMQDLKSQIDEAKQDRTEKAEIKAKKLQAKADAKGDLTETTETKEADTKYLDDLVATCEQKASDFESRQQLRTEELEAIAKAIEIISSGAVKGNAEKHLPSAFLEGHSFSFLRMDAESRMQARASMFLHQKARDLQSRVLSTIADHVAADPFRKVKKMIKDLITKLMEEANEEAEHKGWCDTELATNEKTRKEKTEAVETLHAEIDQLEASLAKLGEDIAELTKAVADLDAAMSKATTIREDEKTTNAETIADSQAAQTAVAQALTVLKEFYEKAGEATALVQQSEEPEIFDSPYKGMGAESGGVVGMLEVIESDFARLEADTKAAEASAQKEYDTFMTDSKVDKAAKSSDIEHKTAKEQDQSQALTVKKDDLEGTQKELDAALAYFDKLKPSCVDSGVSYEDRVARREDEIKSLKDALRILNGEDLA